MYRFIPVQSQKLIYRINVSQVKLLIETLINSLTQYSAVLFKNSIAFRSVMSVIMSSINDRLNNTPIHHIPHHSIFSPSPTSLHTTLHFTKFHHNTLQHDTTHYISLNYNTPYHNTTHYTTQIPYYTFLSL